MDRIVASAQRMGTLIDELLTFAASRDRTLDLQTIDLHALVTEVVAECTSHLRFGDHGTDQKLAQIRITAHLTPEAWVRVEIADRGVGIPAGEHERCSRPSIVPMPGTPAPASA
jgi:signal transduction histidine kinase